MTNSKMFLKNFKKNKALLFLSLPSIIVVFIFSYLPLYGVLLPFKDYKIHKGGVIVSIIKSNWVGIDNFKYILTSGDAFRMTRNTLLMNSIFIISTLVVSLAVALMLNELTRKSVKFYQTVLFFPYFISWVVAAYIFLGLFDMQYGLVNTILAVFGKEAVLWYSEPKYWVILLPLINLWKGVGYSAIIYYTGLIGIDTEYYEAAEIDGASKRQQIFHITIPLLAPLITMLTILAIGRIFYGDFGLFFNVTRDSSALYPVTDVIDTYVYRALRQVGDIGMSAAAGFYQSIVGFILVLITNSIVRKVNSENSLF